MTLWHKRLIIFFAEVFGAIILIITVALFLYYNYFFTKDNFLKYLPKDTVLYSTFKVNKGLEKNLLVNKFLTNLSDNYAVPQLELDLANPLLSYNGALAIIPDQNFNFHYVFLFDLKNSDISSYEEYFNNINWHAEMISIGKLEKNVLVISSSLFSLDKIKNVISQQESSLAQNINVELNLKKLALNSYGKIYLNLELLNDNLSKISDDRYKLAFSSLKSNKITTLYFSIELDDNKVIIATNDYDKGRYQPRLLNKIPKNWDTSLSVSNFSKHYNQIIDDLAINSPKLANKIGFNINYFEQNLNFTFNEDILDILSNNSEIVTNSQNEWILATELDKNAKTSEISDKIDEILKEYISLKNPVIVTKELPDGTFIEQIKKNSDSLVTKQENVANISLNFINMGNDSLAYYIENHVFYLSNSKELLENYLNDLNFVDISEFNCNNNANFSENLLKKISFDNNILNIFNFFNLKVNENNDIWLCLE